MTHDLNSSNTSHGYGGGIGIQMNAGYGGSPGMNGGYGGSPGMYQTPGQMNVNVAPGPQGMNAKINF